MITYEYTISTDFEDGINAICLQSQINNFGFSHTLNGILIESADDTVYIEFSDSLSQSDKEDLDTIVENHVIDKCVVLSGDVTGDSGDAESLLLSSTNAFTPQLKLRMSLLNGIKGRYRISWYYEWGYNKTSYNFRGEIKLNNSDILMNHKQEPKDGGTDQSVPSSGFAYVNLNTGDHTIDLNYWAELGTAYIKNARLEIWRVA